MLLADLQRLYSSLNRALQAYLFETDSSINTLSEENQKLDKLRGEALQLKFVISAHTYMYIFLILFECILFIRNSVSLIRRDLEDFKDEYLEDID